MAGACSTHGNFEDGMDPYWQAWWQDASFFYIVFAERLILKWVDSFNIEIHIKYT